MRKPSGKSHPQDARQGPGYAPGYALGMPQGAPLGPGLIALLHRMRNLLADKDRFEDLDSVIGAQNPRTQVDRILEELDQIPKGWFALLARLNRDRRQHIVRSGATVRNRS